jgi:hypothetical protein
MMSSSLLSVRIARKAEPTLDCLTADIGIVE